MAVDGGLGLGQTTRNTLSTCCFSVGSIGAVGADSLRRGQARFAAAGLRLPSSSSVRPRNAQAHPLRGLFHSASVGSVQIQGWPNGPSTTEMGRGPNRNRGPPAPCPPGPRRWAIEVGQAHWLQRIRGGGLAASSCFGASSSRLVTACRRNKSLLTLPGAARLCSSWADGHIKNPDHPHSRPSTGPCSFRRLLGQLPFLEQCSAAHTGLGSTGFQRRRSSAATWRGLAVEFACLLANLTLRGRPAGSARAAAHQHPPAFARFIAFSPASEWPASWMGDSPGRRAWPPGRAFQASKMPAAGPTKTDPITG